MKATTRACQHRIQGWNIEDGLPGTQDSTGCTPFPEYLLSGSKEGSNGSDSSGFKWLDDPHDFVETDDDIEIGDVESDYPQAMNSDLSFKEWS